MEASHRRRLALHATRAVTFGSAFASASCAARSAAVDDVPLDDPAAETGATGERPLLIVEPTSSPTERRLDLGGVGPDDLRAMDPPAVDPGAPAVDSGAPQTAADRDEAGAGSGEEAPSKNDCAAANDGICPPGCHRDNDADCCDQWGGTSAMWCTYDPAWGCSCAIEGPFAPPSFG